MLIIRRFNLQLFDFSANHNSDRYQQNQSFFFVKMTKNELEKNKKNEMNEKDENRERKRCLYFIRV